MTDTETRGFDDDQKPGLPTVQIGGRDMVAYDFGEDAGKGMENLEIAEQLIPFIAILQGQSPQLKREAPEYIQGAEQGMLFNTATKALFPMYDEKGPARGLPILPVWREHQFSEWVPRNDIELPGGQLIRGSAGGNGFRGIHDPKSPEVDAAIKHALEVGGRRALFRPLGYRNEETNEDTVLIDQYNIGVLYGWPELDEYSVRRAMVAFTSTKIGVYKAFITSADDIKYPNPTTGKMASPPMWAHRWRLRTVSQKNDKGEFYNYQMNIEELPWHKSLVRPNEAIYQMAKEFHKQWEEGAVRGDYQTAAQQAGDGATSAGGSSINPDDKEIPF